jgi:hypothetical protein
MTEGSHGGDYEDRPDDGGSTDLWNVGKLIPVYTALQPRRQPPSKLEPPDSENMEKKERGNLIKMLYLWTQGHKIFVHDNRSLGQDSNRKPHEKTAIRC